MDFTRFKVYTGLAGSFIASFFGGWDQALGILVLFMGLDYGTGYIVAYLNKSNKSEHGGIDTRAGFRGLIKKAAIFVIIIVACKLDLLLEANYFRDAAVIAFIVNECVSILENAALMGVPIPDRVKEALEVLKRKGE